MIHLSIALYDKAVREGLGSWETIIYGRSYCFVLRCGRLSVLLELVVEGESELELYSDRVDDAVS